MIKAPIASLRRCSYRGTTNFLSQIASYRQVPAARLFQSRATASHRGDLAGELEPESYGGPASHKRQAMVIKRARHRAAVARKRDEALPDACERVAAGRHLHCRAGLRAHRALPRRRQAPMNNGVRGRVSGDRPHRKQVDFRYGCLHDILGSAKNSSVPTTFTGNSQIWPRSSPHAQVGLLFLTIAALLSFCLTAPI